MKKLLCVLLFLLLSIKAYAGECSNSFINPIADINWQCIFPINIGGVVTLGDDNSDENIGDPICVCKNPLTIGLNVSFWEPARIVDTVKNAWCLNAIGIEMDNPSPGQGDGGLYVNGSADAAYTDEIFAQMHYYKFPVWAILDMFLDLPCLEDSQFDIAMLSELLPHWNNPILASLLNPEALVFGNPIAKLACSGDAIAAANGTPIDALFWCMGSWGNVYPFTGSITAPDYTEANAGIVARSIYMMGRTGLLLDPGVDSCGSVYTPIWNKSNYKIHLMRPVRDNACRPIGMTGLGWTGGKKQITGGGNYSWMVFRKVKCCIGYTP